jgi:hypothetical protein
VPEPTGDAENSVELYVPLLEFNLYREIEVQRSPVPKVINKANCVTALEHQLVGKNVIREERDDRAAAYFYEIHSGKVEHKPYQNQGFHASRRQTGAPAPDDPQPQPRAR